MGPGLLYAGAAVGVSHLVQSTRAGADYGFDLLWILLLANFIKYPFFQFAPRYAAATGNDLIEGYRRTGQWAMILYGVLTILTMFPVLAAVTAVTAALTGNIFHITLPPLTLNLLVISFTMILLIVGRYKLLDKMMKVVIVVLAFSTVLAVIFALGIPRQAGAAAAPGFAWNDTACLMFLIAFVGWMPAPIDVTVWQSLWATAKARQMGRRATLREAMLDFNIGYIGTAIIAVGFLSLGALVLYGSGTTLSDKGTVFAGQLITMYTDSLGAWAYPVITIAALTTMISTTLTVLDAYPRVLTPICTRLLPQVSWSRRTWYGIWMLVVAAGAMLMLSIFSQSMKFSVDLATTISFVTAPVFALLNHRVVTHQHMPEAARPGKLMRIYSIIGIVFLTLFSLFYMVWRFIL